MELFADLVVVVEIERSCEKYTAAENDVFVRCMHGDVIIALKLFADLVVLVEIEQNCGASKRRVVLRAVCFSNLNIELLYYLYTRYD